nr:piggyBac transposable element-derived protein 2-like [Pseudochaenichthys georgianus]
MKKKGRGTFEEKATSYDGVQLRAVKWHDNRAVHLLSTFASANPTISVQRWDKKKKETVQVTCPSVVHVYNKSMGGVDILDSLIALYRTKIRSRKWYHKIVFHMMDFTLVNEWLLSRKDCGIPKKEVYSLLKFKAEVASCLCNERNVLKKRGRPSHNVDRDLAEKKRRGSASSVPSTPVRQDHTDHWPVWVEKKGRCKYLGCKGIVKVQCSKCVTYLCFTADKNCFMNFHKQ